MKKHVCIHGHFYQPPRENPWTGEVEKEESAAPFHDWNERISKECYRANLQAPILNAKGETVDRVNNFRRISFNFGPTLLSWMRRKDPETYYGIVEADRQSVADNGGHGNAIAQCYNHLIMPLATRRDKRTQILWGVKDFEFHFKRRPEGMWLPEAAVDRESMALMAEEGIKFTILAPHQARRVRHVGFNTRWQFLHHEAVDSKHPYRVLLDNGRQFHVFFYDAPVSRAIAFQGLLSSGDQLAQKILGSFGSRERDQLVSAATDGESYGHHHKFGEMALAWAMRRFTDQRLANVTNYAAFLERYGSHWEADVHEKSSWSCGHGVERWRADCGCRTRHDGSWNQRWRAVLRDAMDALKSEADRIFEEEGGKLLRDPWEARNDYVSVLLDPSAAAKEAFLSRHAKRGQGNDAHAKIWTLLEGQKFSMFMYTSCGWFFDDISGIEPVQVMKFAARCAELLQPFSRTHLENAFSKTLALAKSNLPEEGSGEEVYQRRAKARPAAEARA